MNHVSGRRDDGARKRNNPAEPGTDGRVVGRHDKGRAPVSAFGLQQVEDGSCTGLVNVSGRLVRKDDGWPVCEGPRNRHALLLPTAQLVWSMAEPVTQTDPGKQVGGLAAPVRLPVARHRHGNQDILQGRECAKQVEGLEDDPDLPSTQSVPSGLGQRMDRIGTDPDLTGADRSDPGQDMKEGGLARSRRTD